MGAKVPPSIYTVIFKGVNRSWFLPRKDVEPPLARENFHQDYDLCAPFDGLRTSGGGELCCYNRCTASVISMPAILVDSVAASFSGEPSTSWLLRVSSLM